MKFGYTILYVDDVRRTLDFYVAAFGLSVRFLHESGDFGELETGGTALAFSSRALMRQLGKQPSAPDSGAPCFEIAFVCDDVAVAVDRAVAAGARLVQAGASQDSCRLIHAANRVLFSACSCSRMTASRSGLSVTTPIGDQLRVFPDQRAGLASRAWRYV